MSNNSPNNNTQNEAISPEAIAIIKRAKRSFIFSMSLLIIGLIIVAFAVISRSDTKGGTDNADLTQKYSAGMIIVPEGAKIISAVASEGIISVSYEIEGKTVLRLIDGANGAIIRDIGFAKE